ncbi:MAG: hypothetical protein V2A58_11340 [Planctomycetota bacterium]
MIYRTSLRLFPIALALAIAARPAQAGSPAAIPRLKPLYLETALGAPGKPDALIVAGDLHAALAKDLQSRIREATNIDLPVFDDAKALQDLDGKKNLILLGHFGDNRVIERFYYRGYLIVDASQPGKGGCLLQTVHNPDALGINLIVVGGSDAAGVAKAADRLVENVKAHGPTLPRLFEIELGDGKDVVEKKGAEALDPNRPWPTNQMNMQEALHELALLHVYTADDRFARLFKEKAAAWLQSPESDRDNALDDFWRIVASWDLLEESPVFSDDDRLRITNLIWDELNLLRPKCDTYVFSRKDIVAPRRNHGARSALSVYFAARYFWNYYRIPEMRQWLDDVAAYWKPQMSSWMPMEGSDQGVATLMPATCYALAENDRSFLSRDVLGRIADKPFLTSRGAWIYGGDYGMIWLSLASRLFDDPEYLRPILRKRGSMTSALRFPDRSVRELGRSFWDGRLPSDVPAPADTGRELGVMPLSQLYYDAVTAYGPKNVPYEKAFDFFVFRDRSGGDAQFLEVGGQNAGSYSFDSANVILSFWTRGAAWLTDEPWAVRTIRKLSGVSIVRDGKGEPLPAFARLDRADAGPDCSVTGSSLIDYNGTDWHRNIIHLPEKWFLVIDEVTARKPGDFVLESRWKFPCACAFDGDDILIFNGNYGHLTGTGWHSQYMIPHLYRDFLATDPHPFPRAASDLTSAGVGYRTILARRWTGALREGESRVFANLLHADVPRRPLFALRQLDESRYLVTGPDRNWLVRADADGWLVETNDPGPATSEPAPRRMEEEPPTDFLPLWRRTETARILSSAAMLVAGEARFAVGLADGRIRIRNGQGDITTDIAIPGRVYALCALDDDRNDELLAGTDSAGVRAFSPDGKEIWSWSPPPWKRPSYAREGSKPYRTVITGLAPADTDGDGKPEILAGGVAWYVLDRRGRTLFVHDASNSGESWDGVVDEITFLVVPADVTGDAASEIVGDLSGIGNAGGSSLVHVWGTASDEPLWVHSRPTNRFAGSALKAVVAADFDGDGKDEFAIASDAYENQLGYYDFGPENRGVWYDNVGSGAIVCAAADLEGAGRPVLLVGTEMGQLQAIDAKQNRLFIADVKEAVTALAVRPAPNGSEICVGTVNGRLLVLGSRGEILARGRLPGLVDHLAVLSDGRVLAATSSGELALYGPLSHP